MGSLVLDEVTTVLAALNRDQIVRLVGTLIAVFRIHPAEVFASASEAVRAEREREYGGN